MQHPAVACPPDQSRFLTNVNEAETHEKTTHLLEEILGRKLKGLSFVGNRQAGRLLGQSGVSPEANDTGQSLFDRKYRFRGAFSPGTLSKDADATSLGLGNPNPKQPNLKDSLESTKKETAASKEKQTENITNLTANRSDKLSDGFEFRIKRVPSREESEYLSNSADKNEAKVEAQTEQLEDPSGPTSNLHPERALHFSFRSSELRRSLTESQAQSKSNKVTPNPKPQKQQNQPNHQLVYPGKSRVSGRLDQLRQQLESAPQNSPRIVPAVDSFQELLPKAHSSRVNTIDELSAEQSHQRLPSVSGSPAGPDVQQSPPSLQYPEQPHFPSRGSKQASRPSPRAAQQPSRPDSREPSRQGSLVLGEASAEGRAADQPKSQKKSHTDLPQLKRGILTNKHKQVGRVSANASVYDLAHAQGRPVPPSQAPNRQSSDRVRFQDRPTVWVVQSYKPYLKQDLEPQQKKCCCCQLI